MAFSRRQTLDPHVTNIDRVVRSMEDLIRHSVGPSVSLEFIEPDDLWKSLVDRGQLESALLNLCINARDAMPEGGTLKIVTANRTLDEHDAGELGVPMGDYVAMSVTDTGAGMSKPILDRVFEPFFTTKPTGQGTGLGLSMVYGFAGQSNGSVHIASTVGRGTSVTLLLPRYQGLAQDAEPDEKTKSVFRSGEQETILVVDDEPLIRLVAVQILEELGYRVMEAGDGASALHILTGEVPVDLLVTDVGLPNGMNGRQLAEAARVAHPDLPVLFVTGYAENAVLNAGSLERGMQIMTKPFLSEALASRVQQALASISH